MEDNEENFKVIVLGILFTISICVNIFLFSYISDLNGKNREMMSKLSAESRCYNALTQSNHLCINEKAKNKELENENEIAYETIEDMKVTIKKYNKNIKVCKNEINKCSKKARKYH